MDSTAFSSPRTDCFPAGLRVLVVDDDPTWLKILEKMLNKCSYQVTTCNLAREALNLLRERKDGYDIVISDVNMPDMDGFKLLEHVGLEMDLPVIMMSVDGETSRVMKGVQHGACDYLLKPIRMKELRNIWQHVFRKRIHEVKDIEGHESFDEIRILRNGTEQSDDGYLFSGDSVSGKKRKDAENKYDDRICDDPSSMKKARVVWTVDLHQKFVKAVNQIGFEKVGPKKILDLMGVSWLTRENVASHLQKYRLYLSRLQKENQTKASFCGTKYSDISSKDSAGNVICLQNPVSRNATAMENNNQASESYGTSAPKIQIHNNEPEISEGNSIGGLPMSRTDSQKVIFSDVVDPVKINSSRISFSHPISTLDSDVKFEPKVQLQHSWNAKIPSFQFKEEHKRDFNSVLAFDHLMQPVQQPKVDEAGHQLVKSMETSVQPSYGNSTSQSMERVSKVESITALFSFQPGSNLTNCDAIDPLPNLLWNTKNHTLEHNLFDELESSSKRNMVAGTGSTHKLWDEGFNEFSGLGGFYPPDAYVGNLEMFGYNNQEIIADVPPCLYDSLKFDTEHPSDLVDYAVMDQGLFIA